MRKNGLILIFCFSLLCTPSFAPLASASSAHHIASSTLPSSIDAIAFVIGKISYIQYHVPSETHIGAFNTVISCNHVLVIAIAELLFYSLILFLRHDQKLYIEEGTFHGLLGPTHIRGIWFTAVAGPM